MTVKNKVAFDRRISIHNMKECSNGYPMMYHMKSSKKYKSATRGATESLLLVEGSEHRNSRSLESYLFGNIFKKSQYKGLKQTPSYITKIEMEQ